MAYHRKKQNIGNAFITGITILATAFPFSVFGGSRAEYRVIHGDTLSDIVGALVPGKLYGKKGNLLRVEEMNPHLGMQFRKPDHLSPGDRVKLPDGSHYVVQHDLENKNKIRNPNFLHKNEVLSRIRHIAEADLPKTLTHNQRPVHRKPSSETVPDETEMRKLDESIMTKKSEAVKTQVPTLAKTEPEIQAPIATPLERSKEPEHKKNQFLRSARLEFSPFYRLTSLSLLDSSSGSQSKLISKLYTGMDLFYVQKWKNDFESFVILNLGVVSFEPPKALNKSLESMDHFQSGIGFGARKQFFDSLWVQGSARYQKELFGRAISTTSVTVDTIAVPSLEAKAAYDLISADPFVFGVSGLYGAHFATQASSYPIRQGHSLGGSLYIKQFVSGASGEGGRYEAEPNFQTEVGFYRRSQDTLNIQQTETTLYLNLRFFLSFGRKQAERVK